MRAAATARMSATSMVRPKGLAMEEGLGELATVCGRDGGRRGGEPADEESADLPVIARNEAELEIRKGQKTGEVSKSSRSGSRLTSDIEIQEPYRFSHGSPLPPFLLDLSLDRGFQSHSRNF